MAGTAVTEPVSVSYRIFTHKKGAKLNKGSINTQKCPGCRLNGCHRLHNL